MKKIISVFFAISVISLFASPLLSLAAGKPTFKVSSATAKPGENFKIDISIKDNPGIASAKFKVTFDEDLTLEKVDFSKELGGMTQTSPELSSPAILNWVSPTEDLTADVVYATLNFSTSKDAGEGKHNIEISYDSADVFNISSKTVDFKVQNGVVTISGTATGGSSETAKSETATSSGTQNKKSDESALSTGSIADDGEYVGGEEIIEVEDENGTHVPSDTQKTESKTVPVWIFAVVAVLIAAVAAILIIVKNKTDKKSAD